MSATKPATKIGKSKPAHDRAHDVLRSEAHPLDAIFSPHSVAVIGATERPGSIGRAVLWSLVSSPFGGTVYPVSESRSSVLGIKAYKKVADIPETVDLGVVVTPAATVPGVIAECVEAGIRGAIVISAGFKEHGEQGKELERRILENIRGTGMRLIGPNCLGVMNPISGLNATFGSTMARPGNVAFISQSGALCTAILDWCQKEMVGFSAFVSVGSMLDVGWGDLIDYLGNDPRTHSIVMYMESVGDARAFLSAAREVSLNKPIIIIKAGRTEAAAQAAASHTGSMTGSDEVLDAAFRRSGILRVSTIADLFYMAEVLSKQPRPRGPRLAIVTNAGGPGVLAADSLLLNGGQLAQLSAETMQELDGLLPPHWSHSNPVDILGDAHPDKYAKVVDLTIRDENVDGLLAVICPQGMAEPTQTAEHLKAYAKGMGKPILASWMGGAEVAAGTDILNRAGIPTFPFPDTAAKVFDYMWRYSYNLRGLYETPVLRGEGEAGPDRDAAQQILQRVRNTERTILTEIESKQLLEALRNSKRKNAGGSIGRGSGGDCGENWISRSAESVFGKHHAQDRCWRRAAESARRRCCAIGVPNDQGLGQRTRRSRTLFRSDGTADGQAGRLRVDCRKYGRPAVWPGALVRGGWTTRGGDSRPGPRAATAEYNAGATFHGTDQGLQSFARCAWQEACRSDRA